MKRSEINRIIREADAFLKVHSFYLPPFAYWTPEEWAGKGEEIREILDRQLGWDVTDFGSGNYPQVGLVVFTIRNGDPKNLEQGGGKLYAEKILISEVDQVTPMHFHWRKVEDIINRGGGQLTAQVYNATDDDQLATTDVVLSMDGVKRVVKAGSTVTLNPGESVTMSSRLYHKFWGSGGRVMVGEVSVVNDDHTDNRFYEAVGRFPAIEEDEPPLYLLCTDYPRYCQIKT